MPTQGLCFQVEPSIRNGRVERGEAVHRTLVERARRDEAESALPRADHLDDLRLEVRQPRRSRIIIDRDLDHRLASSATASAKRARCSFLACRDGKDLIGIPVRSARPPCSTAGALPPVAQRRAPWQSAMIARQSAPAPTSSRSFEPRICPFAKRRIFVVRVSPMRTLESGRCGVGDPGRRPRRAGSS